MLTIEGVYDGKKIELLKEIPFKGKKKVLITFLNEASDESGSGFQIDPIKALRGCARNSKLTEKLLETRKEDVELEKSKWRK